MSNMITSIKISKNISQKMLEKIVCDGYGMKGKSKWIVEAIADFIKLKDFIELTNIADDTPGEFVSTSIRIPFDLIKKIDEAVISIREKHPAMEGVRSNIIRASIIQRLIRK
jgi:hypothetical protein